MQHRTLAPRTFTFALAALLVLGATACSRSSAKSSDPTKNGSASADFCALIKQEQSTFNPQALAGKTPAELKTAFEGLVPQIDDAKDAAPSEIKDDVELLSTGYKTIASALADAEYDYSKVSLSSLAGLATPKNGEAASAVAQYVQSHCNVTTPT